ncbi:MAG: hypothetical protein S4CHLAM2_15900 [Chlamydiales bacterium]|nr:hypothetical protein [Chlamydiales bacterium]
MKKRNLAKLALMGVSAGLLVGAAPSQADIQTFYQGLSSEAQNAFNELDASQQMQTVELAQSCGSFGGSSSCGASSCSGSSSRMGGSSSCGASSCNTRSSRGGSSSYMGGSSSCGASSCNARSSHRSTKKNRRTGSLQYFFFGKGKPPRSGSSSNKTKTFQWTDRQDQDDMDDDDYMMDYMDKKGSSGDPHANTPWEYHPDNPDSPIDYSPGEKG